MQSATHKGITLTVFGRKHSLCQSLVWLAFALPFSALATLLGGLSGITVVALVGLEVISKTIFYPSFVNLSEESNPNIPFVFWFTGLSGSGKSTLADLTYNYIMRQGYRAVRLDGDTLRELFKDKGFSREDREAHLNRMAAIAKLFTESGVSVIASFISPYERGRQQIADSLQNFHEIHVDTPLFECERRDVKGLYAKARKGLIQEFTGIDAPYEKPVKPALIVKTLHHTPLESFEQIRSYLDRLLHF